MKNRLYRLLSLAGLTAVSTSLAWVALLIALPPRGPSVMPPQPRAGRGRDLDAIQRSGVLRVALGRDELEFSIHRGRAEGFAFDMALAFANRIGTELSIVPLERGDQALAMLARGEIDMVAQAGAGSRPLLSRVSWSHPFEIAQPVVVGRLGGQVSGIPDLAERRVAVRRHDALEEVVRRWKDQLGGHLHLVRVDPTLTDRDLALGAATGRWPLVVMEQDRAWVEQAVYTPLESSAPLPPTLPVRWAVHPEAGMLLAEVDDWLDRARRDGLVAELHRRYLENPLRLKSRRRPVFRVAGRHLSPYDALFQREAGRFGFDWRLLAALAFAESGYDRWEVSSQGAMGLLQIMPAIAEEYGAEDPFDPEQNVAAGAALLGWLYGLFDEVPESDRLAFALAAYNMGLGHVQDARALAAMRGLDPDRWEGGVGSVLPLLEDPAIADNLPHGRARGSVTLRYVNRVLSLYQRFANPESPAGSGIRGPESNAAAAQSTGTRSR